MGAASSLRTGPRVTIAIVPRERYSFAIESLTSILGNTELPVSIVYVDGRSPPDVSRFVRAQAQLHGFKYLRSDTYLSPNEARNIALKHVDTEFVVFVDNDLFVHPGWLDTLVRCADETGAWLVGPLYLEGGAANPRIHMASGFARIETEDSRRYYVQKHYHPHTHPSDLPGTLTRSPTELLEFHCMLARTDVFRRLGPLDERLLSLHEHVDLCLNVRAAGGTIVFEPAATVRYSFEGKLRLSDLPYIALRWSDEWNASTLAAFSRKWALCDKDPSVESGMHFGRNHRRLLLSQFLPRRLRTSGLASRAARLLLDQIAGAVGRLRYQNPGAEGSKAMSPADPSPVLVPRHSGNSP